MKCISIFWFFSITGILTVTVSFLRKHVFIIVSRITEVSAIAKQRPAIAIDQYENKLGHCEPLTVDFIATLLSKEARHLLYIEKRSPQKILRFDLYTRRNPYKRQMLKTGDHNILAMSNFNASWPVRFTIHGWNGQTTTCSNAAIKDAYLLKGDYNVILIDWSDYSLDINYIRVVHEVFEIARGINAFARFLNEVTGVQFKDMYLIGHSLGVHVAGAAGKLLKPDMYGVIYGLDASGPLYYDRRVPTRLSANDALYVESIQTDISLLGLPTSELGHASFYPNWGLGQPHCPNMTSMEEDFMCDHFSSLYYFVESIKDSRAFGAIKCENYKSIELQKCGCNDGKSICKAQVYMGGDPAKPKRGIYYLSTRKSKPYGYSEICRMKRALPSTISRLNN